jgi:hypothetical protein
MYPYVELATRANRTALRHYPEIERLIGNAVCDPSFAEALLCDPQQALHHGGYHLRMSHDEMHLVLAIRGAADLREFATRLYQNMQSEPGEAFQHSSVEVFAHSPIRAIEQ